MPGKSAGGMELEWFGVDWCELGVFWDVLRTLSSFGRDSCRELVECVLSACRAFGECCRSLCRMDAEFLPTACRNC